VALAGSWGGPARGGGTKSPFDKEASADRARACAINECVILSSKAGIALDGAGCRLAIRQSLVVAGDEALLLSPGKACKGRAGIQATLTSTTFAARRAVVHIGDAPAAGVPAEPVFVHASDCAYLNPFPGKPSKAGLLVWDGEALPRGLVVWQGEREGFDRRLHFAAAPARGVPEAKEGYAPWKRLWGASGVREPRELAPLAVFDVRRWQLERLIVKARGAPGANLERLGITPRKK